MSNLKRRGRNVTAVRRQMFAFFAIAVLISTALLFKSAPLVPSVEAVSNTIVISQLYGGGGNAGSTFTHDFIELFNRGNAPVDVTGWSVQYASATGTTWQTTALSGTIAPGKYYLVQEAQGAGGTTPLPTPDATGTIAMSATAGKVALVNSTTALTGACPVSATIIDLVGFGATANCFEGTAAAPAPSNTTADIRGAAGCTETDQNSTDFATGAPTPRNSATTANPCGGGGPTPPTGVGLATPNTVLAGGVTLLTVTVTPGTNPPSTGITVVGNLSLIGLSSTQAFLDDGMNGDAMIGDGIYSYNATVAPATTAGQKLLPFTVADAEMRSSNGTITLNVQLPPVSIHDIQGNGSTSPLVGQVVTTSGIVTGTKSNGFFIQEPTPDADPNTSEGVFVFTSSTPPGSAAIGNSVTVTGTVVEFLPAAEPNGLSLTEISGSPSVSVNSSGNPLPAPTTITAGDMSPNILGNLERLEGMRVHVATLTVVAPTSGSITESSATVSSSGFFFGVIPGIPRPFREPGIEVTLNVPAGSPPNVPRFDTNPERLEIDSNAQPGAAIIDVTAGSTVSNIIGPLDYAFTTWSIYPDAATPPTVTNLQSAKPVAPATFNELSIASFNMQRFYNNVDDAGGDVVLTLAAYNKRLNKASLAVRNVMRSPDVIGVVEMENLSTLQDVANKINADAVAAGQPNPNYFAYLVEGNDVGLIDVGFLVKATQVAVTDVVQAELAGCMQNAATCYNYVNPNTGATELLNDRPPLILRGEKSGLPFTVIVNHSRSLSGIDSTAVNGSGTEGGRIRFKRKAQAEFLANLIQARQVANPNENLAVIGDFNAFPFNDGYVDVEGTIAGAPTPADQVVLASSDLVNPNLTNLIDTLPADQRYSFTFDGNAQALDYIMVNNNLLGRLNRHAYARNNGDFPAKYYEDGNRPERLSDHDMPVAYFRLAVRNDPADFDGDGRADLSVFRPSSEGFWHILRSGNGAVNSVQFGQGTDRIVPGDYDGDGLTDIATFRASANAWFILQSSNVSFRSHFFGAAGDIPVPADYDGDGKTDVAVFRPSEGAWYILRSSDSGLTTRLFGLNGDKPVQGDYSGDGRADLAVYRPETGAWYVLNLVNDGFSSALFGTVGDKPVQGDYDGDGKTDFAVYRPGSGTWYIQGSIDGFRAAQFGNATDILVPADYDGDGQADIAIFRDGNWFTLDSSAPGAPFRTASPDGGGNWGLGGDKPAPAAYVPEQ